MTAFECILLAGLIVVSVAAALQKKLLATVLLYTGFGLIMSVLWICLSAPDLAITEAAVGAGVSGILFLLTLKKIHALKEPDSDVEKQKRDREQTE